MSKRKEGLSAQEQREILKHNKMEYAYRASSELGVLPIFGSLTRAIGKGWRVCVIASDKDQSRFLAFQQLLKDESLITTISETQTQFVDFSRYQLVLFQGIADETVTQIRNSPQLLGKTHVMTVGEQLSDEYDLISDFREDRLNEVGVISITGNGKGKTTSALGVAAQSLMQEKKVAVIQWFKERKQGDLTWAINEHQFPEKLMRSEQLEFYPTGLGFFGSPNMDRVKGERAYLEHRQKAYEGLEIAKRLISSGSYGLVVLDELIDTVKEIAQNIEYPLIDLSDTQDFLAICLKQSTPIVVTGRRVTPDWSQFVSKSIVISEVKHPWSSKGKGAISGLDF